MMKTAWIAVALSALLGVSIGCGGSGGGGTGGEVDPGAWAYPETQMVVSALYLPLSSQEAKDYAFDLDHNGTVDNQLGNILAALKSSMGSTSPQTSVDDAMGKGDIIVLFAVFAETMQLSNKANLWAFLGNSVTIDPPDGPQAGDTFTINTAQSPTDAYFGGSIKGGGGVFGGDNAKLTLNLPLTAGSSLELVLQAVNMEFDISASCSATACEFTNGKLGGAITENDLNTKVLPEVTNLLADQLTGKCSMTGTPAACVCESGSGAETIQSMFDTNGDCTVTLDEVQSNNIIKAFLKGDVTLKDGSKALSLAVGFDAVNAVYTHGATPTNCP
jgi:hypothetical protein